MREQNQPQAYNYRTLMEDLEAVRAAMPYTGLVAAADENGYRDGFAVLSLSAPYYLSDRLTGEVSDAGQLRDAFLRCDYSQIYAADQEVRIYFVVRDVWKNGEQLPASMRLDINKRIEEKILKHKAAGDSLG